MRRLRQRQKRFSLYSARPQYGGSMPSPASLLCASLLCMGLFWEKSSGPDPRASQVGSASGCGRDQNATVWRMCYGTKNANQTSWAHAKCVTPRCTRGRRHHRRWFGYQFSALDYFPAQRPSSLYSWAGKYTRGPPERKARPPHQSMRTRSLLTFAPVTQWFDQKPTLFGERGGNRKIPLSEGHSAT